MKEYFSKPIPLLLAILMLLTGAFAETDWADDDHEHSYFSYVSIEPGCETEGEEIHECDCGDSYAVRIPAPGHHWHDGVCARCGKAAELPAEPEEASPSETPECPETNGSFGEPGIAEEAQTGAPGAPDALNAAAACSHEEYATFYGIFDRSAAKYADDPGDNYCHRAEGDVCFWSVCEICGARFDIEKDEHTKSVREPHEYGSDGVCRICGHRNSCVHGGGTYTIMEMEYGEIVYEQKNAYEHLATVTCADLTYCSDCGAVLSAANEHTATETQAHVYPADSSICSLCGYANPCRHDGKTNTSMHFSGDFLDNRDGTHTFAGTITYEETCESCGFVLNVRSETAENYVAPHEFSNGRCIFCKAKNSCSHDDPSYLESTACIDGRCVDDGNGKTHSTSGTLHKVVRCLKCNSVVSDTVIDENASETEPHRYQPGSGVCMDCGYKNPCGHPVTEKNVRVDGECIDSGSNRTHTVTGSRIEETSCTVCGALVSRKVLKENVSEKQNHRYKPGSNRCAACGHVNTCKHPSAKIRESIHWKNASYTDSGDGTHIVQGDKFKTAYCDECTAMLTDSAVSLNASESEPHADSGGGRCVCGAKIEGIALKAGNNGTVSIAAGSSVTLIPAFASGAGLSVTGWKSSKPKIASVRSGLVTAGSRPGTAKITVTAAGAGKKTTAASITVRVFDPSIPTKITLNHEKTVTLDLARGETLSIDATIEPETADRAITVRSARPKVVSVTGGSALEPRGVGSSRITVATAKGRKSASFTVKVVDSSIPKSVRIANTELTVSLGGELQLNAEITADTPDPNEKLTWKSSKKAVAAVSETGLVKALREGTAKITATSARNGKAKHTVTVTVVDPGKPAKLTVYDEWGNTGMTFVKSNSSVQLSVKAEPDGASSDVTWSSSNRKAVSVDAAGRVTGIRTASKPVVITAVSTRDRKVKASIRVDCAGE